MPISAEYDRDADALYVRISEGDRVKAVEVNDVTYIDVDADDHPLGIELLYPSLGIDLPGLIKRLALEPQAAEIIAAITETEAPVALTMTGGQYLSSATMLHYAVEGTIGATVGISGATMPTQGTPPLIAS